MGNYYIGAMSILNGKLIKDGVISQWQELSADNGVVYRGFQTNEAPAKYLMDYLSDKGMHFDRIILFVTDECKNDYYMINGERINTIDYFRRALIEHIEQRIKNKEHSYDQTMSAYWPDISGYVDSVLMFEPLSYRPGNKELHDKKMSVTVIFILILQVDPGLLK